MDKNNKEVQKVKKQYALIKATIELPYTYANGGPLKTEKEYYPGITLLQQDFWSDVILTFDTIEEAKNEIVKPKYETKCKGSNPCRWEEYLIEEYIVDSEGEFLDGSDYSPRDQFIYFAARELENESE